MSAPFRRSTFAPVLDSAFRVEGGPALRLAALRDQRQQDGWESFSLLFEGPADAPIGQGLVPLEHDDLGRLELFLVPVGPGSYEAAFNVPSTPQEVGA